MSILHVVKGCPLFYELYDAEILLIVENCSVLTLQPEDFVFKEGDDGNEIYLMLSGSANVTKSGVELATLRKGELFGELVLLNEKTRAATVQCSTYADILVIDYDCLYNLYDTHPKIFALVMLNLTRLLATRLKQAGQTIQKLKTEAAK